MNQTKGSNRASAVVGTFFWILSNVLNGKALCSSTEVKPGHPYSGLASRRRNGKEGLGLFPKGVSSMPGLPDSKL